MIYFMYQLTIWDGEEPDEDKPTVKYGLVRSVDADTALRIVEKKFHDPYGPLMQCEILETLE